MKRLSLFLFASVFCFFLLAGCSTQTTEKAEPPVLTKCINIGNCLEAPKGVSWDVPMNPSYFSLIKKAGFQCVRLPVRFSDYVDKSRPDYLLDESFLKKIDSYINEALSQNLTLVLDLHHFMEIMDKPNDNINCLIAIWDQLSRRYKDYPNTLVFELLNEPQGNLDSATWNSYLQRIVQTIRKNDTKHYLIVGGANYNSIDSLSALELPKDDRLIATVHYYEPNNVTFQGNPYHTGFENLHGITWTGTNEETAYLKTRLETAKKWADAHNVPLFLGEFGISREAPAKTRVAWTSAIVQECERSGISYGYWEFASGFGIYDLSTSTWNTDMLNALVGSGS